MIGLNDLRKSRILNIFKNSFINLSDISSVIYEIYLKLPKILFVPFIH